MSPELETILVGGLVASSCALVGTFLVLRRISLLGDAISHSVLPGIVLAFLWTGSRSPIPMLIGAAAVGVFTVTLVERLNQSRRLHEDASIGVVFPALFSLGVILVSAYASDIDLDLDCVLFGEIGYAPLNRLAWQGYDLGPKALWISLANGLFNLAFVLLFFKELKLTTFDPGLSTSLGFSPLKVHYALMIAVSFTVVASFESVGAILVVAMLIVPPSAAYLLTDRLYGMIALAVLLGWISAAGGYGLATLADVSIAGSMAVASGALFLIAMLASPRYGIWTLARKQKRLRQQFEGQLLLNHVDIEAPKVSAEVKKACERLGFKAETHDRRIRFLLDQGWLSRLSSGELSWTEDGRDASSGYHLSAQDPRSRES